MREVEAQVVAGLVLALAGGVGYLVFQVPRLLDQVLANQKVISEKAALVEQRVGRAEQQIYGIDRRVTTLEAK
jgi:hypothetical protein